MTNKYKLVADYFGTERIKFNEPISNHTVLRVGGPVKLFIIALNVRELIKIVDVCRDLKLSFLIFGTGSKIMISDEGFDGVVIKNRIKNIRIVSIKGKMSKIGLGVEYALVETESGVSIKELSDFLDSHGLSNSGFDDISGSIGGNLFLNKFLQNKVENVKVLNRESKNIEIPVNKLILNQHIILSAVFKVKAK